LSWSYLGYFMNIKSQAILARATAALKLIYVADALSMPVHWFYNPLDIIKIFPGGIKKFEAAPAVHPSSIMSLHSTSAGGRRSQTSAEEPQVVGEIILKGKRKFWGITHQHYHQGMRAGENTLNAHCARLVTRSLIANKGRYNAQLFLEQYIAFMTSDTPLHPDTYAESYHRGFFANLAKGVAAHKCGARTHDTASIGGLVTIAPIAIAELLFNRNLMRVQTVCIEHLYLTHPDEKLAKICNAYVELIDFLLFRHDQDIKPTLASAAQKSAGVDLNKLLLKQLGDNEVVGGLFSKACYIDDSWPSLLFLLYKYLDNPLQALLANTNLGGENCHRGSVLGVLLGLATGNCLDNYFSQLVAASPIDEEIHGLLAA
jgi:ADP-ribosylglycohydrolase